MNRGDVRTEVLVRLGKDTTSAWTSETILNSWINQAHKWAAGYKKWPFTEGMVSTTFSGVERSEYPEGWRSDSIRQLIIGTDHVQKLDFESYKRYREENPSGSDKVYGDWGRSIYVNPYAGLSGTLYAFGQYMPADLANGDALDGTDLVFSGSEDEGNQAIVEEVVCYSMRRDNKEGESIDHHKLAVAALEELWKKITDEQFGYQSTDRGMFKHIDIVGRGGTIDPDQFNI